MSDYFRKVCANLRAEGMCDADGSLAREAVDSAVARGEVVRLGEVTVCHNTPEECGGVPYAHGIADGIAIGLDSPTVHELVEAARAFESGTRGMLLPGAGVIARNRLKTAIESATAGGDGS